MGRIAHERHIHFIYYPGLVQHFKEQSQDLKDYCNQIGEPYGYSAMNVFYMFFYQYWLHEETENTRREYKHAL